MTFGALPRRGAQGAEGVHFRLWAPAAQTVVLHVIHDGREAACYPLPGPPENAVREIFLDHARPGDRYAYSLDGRDPLPDPASRFQPDGVHGWSEVVDPGAFAWTDQSWGGLDPRRAVIYELHVGTFTPEGTFVSAAAKLPLLRDLGITAVELMPLADFPGTRDWGYDGVALYAPAHAYGRPDDLRAFVDAAHACGLAVLIDVVYNHLGPEGAYLPAFAPVFFTHARQTPWGDAVNLDGRGSDGVRGLLIDNALHWIREYHADGLRLDAIHALADEASLPFVAELAAAVHGCGPRRPLVYAEDSRNHAVIVQRPESGGWGLDGIWADDFHHVIRRLLAGDDHGYYADYEGTAGELAETLRHGWLYQGQASRRTGAPRGTSASAVEMRKAVVCVQNHDQIGNRARGERLEHLVGAAGAKLAAVATLIAAPAVPLLFAGEEFAASAPFQYFTSHGDPQLARAVSEGRRREFAGLGFAWPDAIPDPQDEATFLRSKLDHTEAAREPHAAMRRLYGDLLRIRREHAALGARGKDRCRAVMREGAVWVERDGAVLVVLNVGRERTVRAPEEWTPLLHTEDRRYGGALDGPRREVPPRAAVILIKESPRR